MRALRIVRITTIYLYIYIRNIPINSTINPNPVIYYSDLSSPDFTMPALYTQDDVENAYLDVTDNHLPLRRAAAKHGVPRATLQDRLRGIRPLNERFQTNQKLSSVKEDQLVDWVIRQDALGYAPSHSIVRGIVESILRGRGVIEPLGKNWMRGFIKRHPSIRTKMGRRMEAVRFDAFCPKAVNWFFNIFESFNWVRPENVVNVDKGGIMAGFGLDGLVLGSSETKKAYLKSDQGRGWTTFIEAITAAGKALKPGIIFKGKDLQAQWFLQEFQQVADWYYICSDNGWTDNDIACKWLEFVLLPQLTREDESEAVLLLLDGHKSHTSVRYLSTLPGVPCICTKLCTNPGTNLS